MKVCRYPAPLKIRKSSLIMGCFEVIHNGHYALIKKAKSYLDPIAVMLIENPALLPKSRTKQATSLDVRLEQLANLGVNYVIIVNMDEQTMMTRGQDFVNKMVAIAAAKRIIIGKDFRTGFHAQYGAQDIKQDFKNVFIIDFIRTANIKISSTLIKELLETGDVSEINKLSPGPFQQRLCFDQNHISSDLKNYAPIHPGIYACYCEVNDVVYWSLVHIDLNQQAKVYAPDLNIGNKVFRAKIWFQKKMRTIVQAQHDNLTNEDKQITARYLITL